MWGGNDQCEQNCQCSGLITDSFKINSGSNATKRRHEEAVAKNFKNKIRPHPINFDSFDGTSPAGGKSAQNRRLFFESPKSPFKRDSPSSRRIMGDITNKSPIARRINDITNTKERIDISNSPLATALKYSPQIERTLSNINYVSPVTTRTTPVVANRKNSNKISKIFEERNLFRINKENSMETFVDFNDNAGCSYSVEEPKKSSLTSWTLAQPSTSMMDTPSKLDSTSRDSGYVNSTEKSYPTFSSYSQTFIPDDEETMDDVDDDFQSLHDLETEFESDNFDQCSKYEIISTDSPNIISRGSSHKISAKNFTFGAPLAETEESTSFNKPLNRILNFDSPIRNRDLIKKSLKFSDSPTRLDSSKCTTNTSTSSKTTSQKASIESPIKFSINRNLKASPKLSELKTSPKFTVLRSSSLMSNSPAKCMEPKTSLKSSQSAESGFVSEFEESLDIDEHSSSPKIHNFGKLMSGTIKNDFKRAIILTKAKTLFSTIPESPGEKRSLETDEEGVQRKRKKELTPSMSKTVSENTANIMSAMDTSPSKLDLIGDFSVPFVLPLTSGRHNDLKSITSDTLATLLRGDYNDAIDDFQVIDCRYPYEYEGGHIMGAKNLYTPDHVLTLIKDPLQPAGPKRRILVFHCEFSMERGPKMYRFLRSSDRAKNHENYPSLNYPEVYLLHDGYKSFYAAHPELCAPSGYTAMLDPEHREKLKIFRTSSMKRYHSEGRKKKLMW